MKTETYTWVLGNDKGEYVYVNGIGRFYLTEVVTDINRATPNPTMHFNQHFDYEDRGFKPVSVKVVIEKTVTRVEGQ